MNVLRLANHQETCETKLSITVNMGQTYLTRRTCSVFLHGGSPTAIQA